MKCHANESKWIAECLCVCVCFKEGLMQCSMQSANCNTLQKVLLGIKNKEKKTSERLCGGGFHKTPS